MIMHGGTGKMAFIFLAVFILIDIYAFRGLRQLTLGLNSNVRIILTVVYWAIPVFISIMTFYIMSNMGNVTGGKLFYRTFYGFMGIMVLFYVPKMIFSGFELGNDISNGVVFLLKKFNIAQNDINVKFFRYTGAFVASAVFLFTFTEFCTGGTTIKKIMLN